MTSPPSPPSAASRRGDLPSHTRAEPAARPQMLSETRAMATKTSPRSEELQGHMAPGRIGELRQHRGHEDRGLGVGDPHDVALAAGSFGCRAAPSPRRSRSRAARRCRNACTPRNDHVHRADELDRGEERRRALDERSQPERDDDHLRVRAGGVPEHRRHRRTASQRDAPADDEEHARAGDDDQRKRRRREREQGVGRNHERGGYRRRVASRRGTARPVRRPAPRRGRGDPRRRRALEARAADARDRGLRDQRLHGRRRRARRRGARRAGRRRRRPRGGATPSSPAGPRSRSPATRSTRGPGRSSSFAIRPRRVRRSRPPTARPSSRCGGVPGEAFRPSPWEWSFAAEPLVRRRRARGGDRAHARGGRAPPRQRLDALQPRLLRGARRPGRRGDRAPDAGRPSSSRRRPRGQRTTATSTRCASGRTTRSHRGSGGGAAGEPAALGVPAAHRADAGWGRGARGVQATKGRDDGVGGAALREGGLGLVPQRGPGVGARPGARLDSAARDKMPAERVRLGRS